MPTTTTNDEPVFEDALRFAPALHAGTPIHFIDVLHGFSAFSSISLKRFADKKMPKPNLRKAYVDVASS